MQNTIIDPMNNKQVNVIENIYYIVHKFYNNNCEMWLECYTNNNY